MRGLLDKEWSCFTPIVVKSSPDYVIAARDAALRLAGGEAFAGLLLLMRGERQLAPEFDALGLGVGPAARGAFENAPPFELGRDAEHGKDELGKV